MNDLRWSSAPTALRLPKSLPRNGFLGQSAPICTKRTITPSPISISVSVPVFPLPGLLVKAP